MQKVFTDVAEVQLLECISPKRDRWAVRCNVKEEPDGVVSYMEEIIGHKPTREEVGNIITGWIDEQATAEIREGLVFDGSPVWLSIENQVNYQRDYSRAMATNGASLPVTVKLGTDDAPRQLTLDTVEKITEFYEAVAAHITTAQAKAWAAKAAIDWESYVTP